MHLSVQDEGHDTAEARPAADFLTGSLQLGEFVEHLVHIQIKILGRSGVTGRIDSRGSSQRIHFQSRVVREAVAPFPVINIARLLERVLLQCLSRLRDVLRDSEIRRSNQLKSLSKNLGSLSQLTPVARRENYLCHVALKTKLMQISAECVILPNFNLILTGEWPLGRIKWRLTTKPSPPKSGKYNMSGKRVA